MTTIFFRRERFEKLAGGHFWLSETPDKVGSKSWDSSLPRMASWVKLRDKQTPDAAPILLLNTHFDHKGPQSRLAAAQLVRQQIRTLGAEHRIILTGDFNTGEGTPPYQALFAADGETASPVIDSYRSIHPEAGKEEGTYNGFKPAAKTGARIDWIAVSRDWRVVSAAIDHTERDGRVPSDHFPITAVLGTDAKQEARE